MDLNKFKMGYFILWKKGNDIFSTIISNYQMSKGFDDNASQYTHIDVCGGGQYAVRTNPPKTKIVDIRKHYKGREYCLVRYKNESYEKNKKYKVAFWSASHCNLNYDYLGVLKFQFSWIFHIKNLWFCSENASWALQKEFPKAFNGRQPFEMMPADFLNKDEFEIVLEGKIE
jgi:hypothetical protein